MAENGADRRAREKNSKRTKRVRGRKRMENKIEERTERVGKGGTKETISMQESC